MSETSHGTEVLSGDPSDPKFVGKCFEFLAKEIRVLKEVNLILVQAVSGIMAGFDALDDQANLKFSGPMREVVRNAIRQVEATNGKNSYLDMIDQALGRQKLRAVPDAEN